MKVQILSILLLALVMVQSMDCSDPPIPAGKKVPKGFPTGNFGHANCNLVYKTAVGTTCAELEKQVQHNVDTFKPEPEAKGIYEAEQCHEGDKEGDYVWANRLTGDRKYTDDVTINFYQEADYCRVVGFSRSRVLSVYDYSTNYCNIRNLLFHTGVEFQGAPEIVTCSYPPTDVAATCAIH